MDGVTSTESSNLFRYEWRARANWSALLAGALLILAVGLVLTGIGWGITFVAMRPTDLLGGFVAGAIILAVSTFIAACAGGYLAGWLLPRGRTIGGLHGLLACALAFLVSSMFWLRIVSGALGAVGGTVATTAQTAAATTQAVGAQGGDVASGAVNFLTSLGYSDTEARTMVRDAQRSIQRGLRNARNGGTQADADAAARAAVNGALDATGGAVWIYTGVWLISMLLAFGFGALGAKRGVDYSPVEERVREPVPGGYVPPLRPQEV